MYDNEFSGLWKSSILSEKDFKEREPEMNRRQTNMDIGDSNKNGLLYGYLTTPNGSLQKYNPVTGKHKEIFNEKMKQLWAE
jgi:hypothetical protein